MYCTVDQTAIGVERNVLHRKLIVYHHYYTKLTPLYSLVRDCILAKVSLTNVSKSWTLIVAYSALG
jgi:hypothetical protein